MNCFKSLLFVLCVLTSVHTTKAQNSEDIELLSSLKNDSNGFKYALGKRLGEGITSFTDLDENGFNEIILSNSRGSFSEILVLFMEDDHKVKSTVTISEGKSGLADNISDRTQFLGHSLDRIPDLDGDGIDEIAVSNVQITSSNDSKGEIFIFMMSKDGTVKKHVKIGENQGGLKATFRVNEQFGNELTTIGDVNGDGITDLAVGSLRSGSSGLFPGALWILMLNSDGTVKEHKLITEGNSGFDVDLAENASFGKGLAGMGDFDGDGFIDVAVGELGPQADDPEMAGAIWLLSLNKDGSVKKYTNITSKTANFNSTLYEKSGFGNSICSGYDLDSNGIVDLVTAHWDTVGSGRRRVLDFIYLNKDGSIKKHAVVEKPEYQFTYDHATNFGTALEIIPDVNNDMKLDLLVSAPLFDLEKKFDLQGKIFIFSMDGPIVVKAKKPEPAEGFSIYPNPSSGQFQIANLAPNSRYQLAVHHINGQQVHSQQVTFSSQVNVSQKLQPGIYFVSLTNQKHSVVKKLIIH